MIGESLQPIADPVTTRNPSKTGTVVALRPIQQTPRGWEPTPQRMALLALDSGQWAFAWVRGAQHLVPGLRVEFREHSSDTKFPTFTPVTQQSPAKDVTRTTPRQAYR